MYILCVVQVHMWYTCACNIFVDECGEEEEEEPYLRKMYVGTMPTC